MQPPFDIYSGLFSAAELAEIADVPRPIIDVWVNRSVIKPTRRQRAAGAGAKKVKGAVRLGRPFFSCRNAFTAALIRTFGEDVTLGSTESSYILAAVASGGEWMWSCARHIEDGKPLNMYGYATRHSGKWIFDMHVGASGEAPCFGWDVPHVFVPMSGIFSAVYHKCKRLVSSATG